MRTTRTETVGGKCNSDATIAIPGPWAVRKGGTGVYYITFPGRRIVGFSSAPGSGQAVLTQAVPGPTPDSIQVNTLNAGFAAADCAVTFTAVLVA